MLDRNININRLEDGYYNNIGHTEPGYLETFFWIIFVMIIGFIVGLMVGVSC